MKLKNGVIITEEKGEFIAVVSEEAGKAFNGIIRLNSTAAFILDLMRDETDIRKITDKVCDTYDVTYEIAEENVITTIKALEKIGLIE